MSVDLKPLVDAAVSHALTTGLFERVNGYEPKSSPGYGLTAAVWAQSVGPVQSSGLASSSGRIELSVRIYTNMLTDPPDAIDPAMIGAVSTLLASYSGDFDLGVSGVRNVDLLGMTGTPLSAQAGYLNQDGKLFRVMTITLPIVVNDVWYQAV